MMLSFSEYTFEETYSGFSKFNYKRSYADVNSISVQLKTSMLELESLPGSSNNSSSGKKVSFTCMVPF